MSWKLELVCVFRVLVVVRNPYFLVYAPGKETTAMVREQSGSHLHTINISMNQRCDFFIDACEAGVVYTE